MKISLTQWRKQTFRSWKHKGMVFYGENPKDSTKKQLEQMNLVKLQDTKLTYRNLVYFYTFIMNYQKEKLRKQSHLQLHQKE